MINPDSKKPSISEFQTISNLIRVHAAEIPDHEALVQEGASLTYLELNALLDRIAFSFQRDGLKAGDVISICALNSVYYAAIFLGALRAGLVTAPIAPSVTPEQFRAMLRDSGARCLFVDGAPSHLLDDIGPELSVVSLGVGEPGLQFEDWVDQSGTPPIEVVVIPETIFNIIYSSGTTGTPKGIAQSHGMRWAHIVRGIDYEYDSSSRTLLATPLYSNTTLVSFFPTLGLGGTVVLLRKFDARDYLQVASAQGITHAMLVPVQYQRIMALPDFDTYDLSSFHMKFCTSSPFKADLKLDILRRWPGGLIEIYGMTEGGAACVLYAHDYPEKLHTVGRLVPGHEIRLLGDDGKEVASNQAGEIVGRSPSMMTEHHGHPEKTKEFEWYDASGNRFFRTGDIGKLDEDGFLMIVDRKKDMIISGGFNIYPSDLEDILAQHQEVIEAAVIGVPSEKWGETPFAYVVTVPNSKVSETDILTWYNAQTGSVQRLSGLKFSENLPRNGIGKLMKRELLRDHLKLFEKLTE
ncbi:MAG: class I adenylate-forming enzyme family protein [Halioglobus sp.]